MKAQRRPMFLVGLPWPPWLRARPMPSPLFMQVFHSLCEKNPHKIWRKRLQEFRAHVIYEMSAQAYSHFKEERWQE